MRTSLVETALGWVAFAETERGVRACSLPHSSAEKALAAVGAETGTAVSPAQHELAGLLVRYYGGESVDLSGVPLDLPRASAFTARVREVVRAIPRGETLSYGQVAARAGSPRAARAVGQVMATNPVPPLVPCHRVLASGGALGGYGGGLPLKRRLLECEGYSCAPS
jgi:methylated-DNA-[protein]-cysteine S-methyltransferase